MRRNLLNRKRGSIAHSLSLSSTHRPDMTERVGVIGHFSLVYHFSFLSPTLWETARYRLKNCLKGPLSPKQPNNQPDMTEILLKKDVSSQGIHPSFPKRQMHIYCMPATSVPTFRLMSQKLWELIIQTFWVRRTDTHTARRMG